MTTFSILFFGMTGVLARYAIGSFVTSRLDSSFPVGTFGINIVGAFLIGIIYVLGIERSSISPELRLGIMVGLLGGFTTFSSYCLETVRLIEEARYWEAALYWTSSPILGLGATVLGIFVTRRIAG